MALPDPAAPNPRRFFVLIPAEMSVDYAMQAIGMRPGVAFLGAEWPHIVKVGDRREVMAVAKTVMHGSDAIATLDPYDVLRTWPALVARTAGEIVGGHAAVVRYLAAAWLSACPPPKEPTA